MDLTRVALRKLVGRGISLFVTYVLSVHLLLAQAVFTTSSTAVIVAEAGQTELTGSVSLVQLGGTTVPSVLFISYDSLRITNPGTAAGGFAEQGITLTSTLVNAGGAAVPVSISSVQTTPGIIWISIGAGAVSGSLTLRGVRVAVAGTGIKKAFATLTTTSPGALTFTAPALPVIGDSLPGVDLEPSADILVAIPNTTATATFKLKEGFREAFSSAVGALGRTTPTQVLIQAINPLPGVTLTFPAVVASQTGSTLTTIAGGAVTLPTAEGSNSVLYSFSAVPSSDTTLEEFPIPVAVNFSPTSIKAGNIQFKAALAPFGEPFPTSAPISRYAAFFVPLSIDEDLDGLTNEDEMSRGTDPLNSDTDRDGLKDGDEVKEVFGFKTDPLKADTDGGGLTDGEEIRLRFNPTVARAERFFSSIARSLSTRIAVLNPLDKDTNVSLLARDPRGNTITGSGITNPSSFPLRVGSKLSVSLSEAFGAAIANSEVGSVTVTSNNDAVFASFMAGDEAQVSLDGTSAGSSPLREFIFSDISAAGASFTRLSAFNPNPDTASLSLSLISSKGQILETAPPLTLPAFGSLNSPIRELFRTDLATIQGGYIRGTSSRGVVAAELYGDLSKIAFLNAQPIIALEANQPTFIPYFVTGRGFASKLNLINSGTLRAMVTLTALRGDGSILSGAGIANPFSLTLEPGEQFVRDVKDLFGIAGDDLITGSLQIDAIGVVGPFLGRAELGGSLTFTSFRGDSLAAIPLILEAKREILLLEIEESEKSFTGVAIINPSKTDAVDVKIELLTKEGSLVGIASARLNPGASLSRLVRELLPAVSSQSASSLRITASEKVIAFGIQGATDLSSLVAVLPQSIR